MGAEAAAATVATTVGTVAAAPAAAAAAAASSAEAGAVLISLQFRFHVALISLLCPANTIAILCLRTNLMGCL